MVTIVRKKWFVKITDIYFAEAPLNFGKREKTDIAIYTQALKKEKNSKEFHTLILDLTDEEEEIFLRFNSSTKRKIRNVNKGNSLKTIIRNTPSTEEINKLKEFYDIFAKQKGINKCDRLRLEALKEEEALTISWVEDPSGDVICYHAYVVDERRARGLYSASHFRLSRNSAYKNFISNVNRYLHWQDIKHFKNRGLFLYDFGGVSSGEDSPELLGINKFKLDFGGELIVEYNSYKALSYKGSIALWLSGKGRS